MISFRALLFRMLMLAGMAGIIVFLTALFSPNENRRQTNKQHTETADIVSVMAKAYAGEIDYAPGYSALDPLTATTDTPQKTLFNPQDDYWGLPRTVGYEEIAAYCAACHSLRIVMQQRQNRDGWDYLLTWMSEKQGMAPLHPDDRAIIINYLAQHFAEGE